jgi:NADH-quinone oxidoreductase subunit C
VIAPAPVYASNDGVLAAAHKAIGDGVVLDAVEAVGELTLTVGRDAIVSALTALRDDLQYQQLMEIAGVDYPERAERFEVVYHLLSVTRNHRIRVKVSTDTVNPVPSVTGLWPVAGWLEREVFDMYGVQPIPPFRPLIRPILISVDGSSKFWWGLPCPRRA